ncbi:hypothetical protein CP02DC14_2103, partial [Chlamydia psittaci 02DC14]
MSGSHIILNRFSESLFQFLTEAISFFTVALYGLQNITLKI